VTCRLTLTASLLRPPAELHGQQATSTGNSCRFSLNDQFQSANAGDGPENRRTATASQTSP